MQKATLCILLLWTVQSGGCEPTGSELCTDVECGHGACQELDGGAQCLCEQGYTSEGLSCVPVLCANVDCGHGRCEVSDVQASCDCDEGYHAQELACVSDDNACEEVDCGSFGQCQVTADDRAECDCDDGYHAEGLSCIEDADSCEDVDCGHGVCQVNADNRAECNCNDGYHAQGLSCVEDVHSCQDVDCGHGECEVGGDSFAWCNCDDGYHAEGLSCVPDGNEVCDAVDNDGDGLIDEGCDDDNDGYCDEGMQVFDTNSMCINTIIYDFSAGELGDDCDDEDGERNLRCSVDDRVIYRIGSDGDYPTWDAFLDAVPSPPVGTDVLFRRGEVHSPVPGRTSFQIGWSGTADDWVVIGAYGNGAKPVLDGMSTYPGPAPCSDYTECNGNLLGVNARDERQEYIKVENIRVEHVEGNGMHFRAVDHLRVVGCEISDIFGMAFGTFDVHEGQVTDSLFESFSTHRVETDPPYGGRGQGVTFNSSVDVLFARNHLRDGKREGLGMYGGSSPPGFGSRGVITQNLIENVTAGIYVCRAGDTEVTHNVLVSTVERSSGGGTAIGVTEEPPDFISDGGLHDVLVASNIVVGPWGTAIWVAPNNEDADAQGINIFNNTIVGAAKGLLFNNPLARPITGSIAGNMIYVTETFATMGGSFADFDFGPNLWAGLPGNSILPEQMRHSGDLMETPSLAVAGVFDNLQYDEFAISQVALEAGSAGTCTAPDASTYFTRLFAASADDPRRGALSTVAAWDFGAVDSTAQCAEESSGR